jgi:hypothetical protein
MAVIGDRLGVSSGAMNRRWLLGLAVGVRVGLGLFEAAEGGLLTVGEALGVDAEQDGDAVARPAQRSGRGRLRR